MWGYQIHFRVSAQTSAQSLFSKLDSTLSPHVFLVGVLTEERKDRHPVCLEPEDCGYDVSIFSKVNEQAIHYEATDPDRLLFHSHPVAEENHRKSLKRRALQKAILNTIQASDDYRELVSFSSWPILVDGYFVCLILQFNRNAFKRHYALTKNKYNDQWWIATSLIDATIKEYLEGCSKALMEPNPGAGLDILGRDHDELIRSAGKTLMYTPASAGGDIEGLHGLFNSLNTISSLRYEGSESIGSMIICKKGHPNVQTIVELLLPVPMNNPRAVRKLLETSSNDLSLLCDSANVYALGHLSGLYDAHAEDLFTISFTKHYTWDLLHDRHVLMRVAYGQPSLARSQIDKKKFQSDILRLFGKLDPQFVDAIWQTTIEATKQKHGTMLVISGGAANEAERLQMQSTRIQPVKLTTNLMQRITKIDGAVLISPDCICHAMGVILDGLASSKGTPSRGARYNSAIRYVESSKYPTLAVVISEDGTIDLVPDLRPQISRTSISKILQKFRDIAKKDPIPTKEFYQTIDWLTNHSFYLDSTICAEVNSLRGQIEARLDKTTDIRIIYRDLVPNAELNDSYFLD